jgi:hypothetical protein
MSMKKSIDTIRIRTRDIPVCSAVPQPSCNPILVQQTTTKVSVKTTVNNFAPELNHSAQRCLPRFYTSDFNF